MEPHIVEQQYLANNNDSSIEITTRYATLITFFLLIILLINNDTNNSSTEEISTADKTLLMVAFLSYLGLSIRNDDLFRYIDWIITTPLLLYTFWLLARQRGYNRSFVSIGVAAALMSALGLLASTNYNKQYIILFLVVSWLLLVYILYEVYLINNFLISQNLNTILPYFFYILWPLYGLVFFIKDLNTKYTLWNILDFLSKGVYTVVLVSVIQQ